MIRLDSRVGSVELERLFRPYGIRVEVTTLAFGDIDFYGNGPHGLASIVIERKVIQDLVNSMQSRRLSGHQLPGMLENHDYCYLIVEGIWRPGEDGALETYNGSGWTRGYGKAIPYRAVDNYLSTLELQAGVIYRRTSGPHETVATVVDLYHYWSDKEWHEHRAHSQVYAPSDHTPDGRRRLSLAPRQVSIVEKVAMQLPGIDSIARGVAGHFLTVEDMVAADEKEWMTIPKIGEVRAQAIVNGPRWKRRM